jgi:hypothetical protein
MKNKQIEKGRNQERTKKRAEGRYKYDRINEG